MEYVKHDGGGNKGCAYESHVHEGHSKPNIFHHGEGKEAFSGATHKIGVEKEKTGNKD